MSKKNRRALRRTLLSLSMMLVVAFAAIGGTIAWLTAETGVVTNTFTVGNVKITLDEAKVNPYGKPVNASDEVVTLENAPRQTENTYKLLPGHTYTKDPTIHVAADSEECWVFVKVENEISDIEDINATIVAEMTANDTWKLVKGETNVYAYKEKVSAGANVVVFSDFKLAENADVASYAGKTIKITGYAIQADGIADAATGWEKLSAN